MFESTKEIWDIVRGKRVREDGRRVTTKGVIEFSEMLERERDDLRAKLEAYEWGQCFRPSGLPEQWLAESVIEVEYLAEGIQSKGASMPKWLSKLAEIIRVKNVLEENWEEAEQELKEKRKECENYKQEISNLKSERSAMKSSLEREAELVRYWRKRFDERPKADRLRGLQYDGIICDDIMDAMKFTMPIPRPTFMSTPYSSEDVWWKAFQDSADRLFTEDPDRQTGRTTRQLMWLVGEMQRRGSRTGYYICPDGAVDYSGDLLLKILRGAGAKDPVRGAMGNVSWHDGSIFIRDKDYYIRHCDDPATIWSGEPRLRGHRGPVALDHAVID